MKRKLTKQKWYVDNKEKKVVEYHYKENELKAYALDDSGLNEIELEELKKQYLDKSYISHKSSNKRIPCFSKKTDRFQKKCEEIFFAIAEEGTFRLKERFIKNDRINTIEVYKAFQSININPKRGKGIRWTSWEIIYSNIVEKKNLLQEDFFENVNYKIIEKELLQIMYKYNFPQEDSVDNTMNQMNRSINASVRTYEAKNVKINREQTYENLISLMNNDKLEHKINSIIAEKYKLEELCEKIDYLKKKQNSWNNKKYRNWNNGVKKGKIIKVIKTHYQEEVHTSNELSSEEKLLLKICHEVVKSRYRKIDKNYVNKEQLRLFEYEKLEGKIKRKINNKVLYRENSINIEKAHNIDTMNFEQKEIAKQLLKANETLRLKLAENIVDINATFASKDSNKKNSDIISSAIGKLTENYRIVESIFPNSWIYFVYASRLRNYTHHRQAIEIPESTVNDCYLNYNQIDEDIRKYYVLESELINYQIDTSKIKSYYSEKEIKKVLKNINSETVINYLPRFNQIFIRMMKLVDEKWIFLGEEEQQAQKRMFKFVYENNFMNIINKDELLNKENFFKTEIEFLLKNQIDDDGKLIIKNPINAAENIEIENISAIKEFTEKYKVETNSLKEYKESMQKIPADINSINKRIIDVVTIIFMNYISSEELNNLYQKPKLKEISDYNLNLGENFTGGISYKFEDKSKLVLSVYSLHKYLPRNKLNNLNNNLKKYVQYNESLIKKYGKEKIEEIFNELELFFEGNLDEIIIGFKEVIKLFTTIIKIPEQIDLAQNVAEGTFENRLKLNANEFENIAEYYNINIEKSENIYYKYCALNENNGPETRKQNILILDDKETNEEIAKTQIYFKKLVSINKFGEVERYKDIHNLYLNNFYKSSYKEILKEFGKYKSIDRNNESNIEAKYKEYNELLQKEKTIGLNENDDKKIKVLNTKINEYTYLKNMSYLTIIDKARKLKYDLHSRLISWMTEIENWLYYKYKNEIENYDKNKSIVVQLQNINGIKDIEFIEQIVNLRNEIMHYKLNIKTEKFNSHNTIELYIEIKEIFNKLSIKKYNDVENVFAKILEKHNIVIETENYKKYLKKIECNKISCEDCRDCKNKYVYEDLKFKSKKRIVGTYENKEIKLDNMSQKEVDYYIQMIKHRL